MPASTTSCIASLASARTAGSITRLDGVPGTSPAEPRGSTMRGCTIVPSGRANALKARTIWIGVTAISWPMATEVCV